MTNNNSLWGQTNQLEDLEQQWRDIDNSYMSEDRKEKARAEIFDRWISQTEDWESKLESCGYAAKCLEKEANAIASMISDLRSRQQRKEAEAKRLKTYMTIAMLSRSPKSKRQVQHYLHQSLFLGTAQFTNQKFTAKVPKAKYSCRQATY